MHESTILISGLAWSCESRLEISQHSCSSDRAVATTKSRILNVQLWKRTRHLFKNISSSWETCISMIGTMALFANFEILEGIILDFIIAWKDWRKLSSIMVFVKVFFNYVWYSASVQFQTNWDYKLSYVQYFIYSESVSSCKRVYHNLYMWYISFQNSFLQSLKLSNSSRTSLKFLCVTKETSFSLLLLFKTTNNLVFRQLRNLFKNLICHLM